MRVRKKRHSGGPSPSTSYDNRLVVQRLERRQQRKKSSQGRTSESHSSTSQTGTNPSPNEFTSNYTNSSLASPPNGEDSNSDSDGSDVPGAVHVAGMYAPASPDDDDELPESVHSNTNSNNETPMLEATLVEDDENANKQTLPTTHGRVVDTKKRRRILLAAVLVTLLTVAGLIAGLVRSNRKSSGTTSLKSDPIAFKDSQELQLAVIAYLNDPSENSPAAKTYGFPISAWQVERVTDFSNLFSAYRVDGELLRDFDEPLTDWNTSQATNMAFMFGGCYSFNQSLDWDTSNVANMTNMFNGCNNFEGRGLESWDTGRVVSFQGMFAYASNFNADVGGWGMFLKFLLVAASTASFNS